MAESIEDYLTHVADEVEGRLDDLVDAILARVSVLPGYATGRRPGDIEDIGAGFRDSTRLFLACLRHDRAPTEAELRRIALIGTQRARQGLPGASVSASLDHAQRVGFEFVLDGVRRVADESVRADVTLRAWARLSDFMTAVRAVLLGGYDDAQGEPFTGARREAAVFVERFLGKRWTSETEIRSHASSAGVVLGRSSALLLVVPVGKQGHESLREASGRVADTIPGAVEGPVRWSPLLYVPVLVGGADEHDWTSARRTLTRVCAGGGVSIAMVGPLRSLAELADGFTRIEDQLTHVPAARRSPAIVDGRELEVLHVLTGQATLTQRIAFVRRVLGPVLRHDRAEEFLAVLDAVYTTDGSATGVAAALHLSRSSVLRRFRAIAQLTGRQVDVMCERYELLTAVRLQLLLTRELQSVDGEPFTAR